MISYEQFHRIRALQGCGLSAGQIASRTGISEKTARLWMGRERYEPKRRPPPRPGKLSAWTGRIGELLVECDSYTAVQIFDKLRAEGYEGSYTLVKEHVRKVRPRKRRVYEDLVFAPGEAAQVDFGECGLTEVGNSNTAPAVRKMGNHLFIL